MKYGKRNVIVGNDDGRAIWKCDFFSLGWSRSALEIFLWIASYRIILRNKVSNVTFSYYVSIESAALIGRATSVSRAGAWHVAIINNVVRSWQSRLMEGRFPRNRKFRDDGVEKRERERGEKKRNVILSRKGRFIRVSYGRDRKVSVATAISATGLVPM